MAKRSICAILTGLLLLGTLLTGCGEKTAGSGQKTGSGSGTEPVTLTFLFGDAVMMDWFCEYFPEYISGDNADGITVEVEYQKEANQVLQVKSAAGEIPDMVSTGLPQEMVDQGKFLDLSEESWWDDLNPSAKELSVDVKSGKNYFVPMCMGAVGLFYNRDVFEELGLKEAETWEELMDNLRVIRDEKPDMVPFYICGKEAYTFGHMIDFMVDGVAKEKLGYSGFETAASQNDLETLGWNAQEDGILSIFARDLLQMQEEGL